MMISGIKPLQFVIISIFLLQTVNAQGLSSENPGSTRILSNYWGNNMPGTTSIQGGFPIKMNALTISAGTILLSSNIMLNYERVLFANPTGFITALSGKIGVGRFFAYDDDGTLLAASAQLLTGRRNHHIEASLGIGTVVYVLGAIPVAGVGYRYQKPEGGFIFRMGANFPELLYLGMGIGF